MRTKDLEHSQEKVTHSDISPGQTQFSSVRSSPQSGSSHEAREADRSDCLGSVCWGLANRGEVGEGQQDQFVFPQSG